MKNWECILELPLTVQNYRYNTREVGERSHDFMAIHLDVEECCQEGLNL